MPLPLIPLAFIGASALLGGGMALNAKGRIDKAKAREKSAHSAYNRKIKSHEFSRKSTEQKLQELGRKRAEGMSAVRDAIRFIQRAKLVNPSIISDAEISMDDLDELDRVYENILKTVGGIAGSMAGGVGVGVLTALGAYGLVGTFGVASTGAAISGLSGAAATSATLAWFGGGSLAAGGLGIAGGTAILGGIVAAPAVIALGVFGQLKAGDVEKKVDANIRKMKIEEAKMKRENAKLNALSERVVELHKTITKLTSELRGVLQNADPSNPEDVYRVVQLAKVLRVALDEPVIEPPQKLPKEPGSKKNEEVSEKEHLVAQLANTLRTALDESVIEPSQKLTAELGAKKNEKVSHKENPKREARTDLGRPLKLRPNERIEMARHPSEQCADGKMRQRCQNKRTRGYYCPLHGST